MVKKTLGYVELEWTCSQCGTRNPGPQKACTSCGSPQSKRVEFDQAPEEKLLTDKEEIARAKAGPDVHCAFCGARNPAGAERCTQCNADLGEAQARESGRVLGAHRSGAAAPVKCPKCGAENPGTAKRCSQCNSALSAVRSAASKAPSPRKAARPSSRRKTSRSSRKTKARTSAASKSQGKGAGNLILILFLIGFSLAVLCGCVMFVLSQIPAKQTIGVVESVSWERRIEIEELGNVTHEDWRDEIPSDARIGTCREKYRRTQDSPAPNATEVCGTPYTVDTGTGHGEVVQDCEYEVYDDWCQYTVRDWKKVDTEISRGDDLRPYWPDPYLSRDQREGERDESYKVVLDADGERYTYHPRDEADFRRCQIGTRWSLTINVLGNIKSMEPAQ